MATMSEEEFIRTTCDGLRHLAATREEAGLSEPRYAIYLGDNPVPYSKATFEKPAHAMNSLHQTCNNWFYRYFWRPGAEGTMAENAYPFLEQWRNSTLRKKAIKTAIDLGLVRVGLVSLPLASTPAKTTGLAS